MKKIRDITIKGASNGILVRAGCLGLVYGQDELDVFLCDLKDYLFNPEETETKIRNRWGIPQSPVEHAQEVETEASSGQEMEVPNECPV